MTDLEADRLRNERLGEAIDEWERESGPPSAEQRAEVAAIFDEAMALSLGCSRTESDRRPDDQVITESEQLSEGGGTVDV